MVKFIIVRHGFSLGNKDGIFTGQLDVPLDEIGFAQAEAAAKYILENFTVDEIYSSELCRAYDTALPVAKALSKEVKRRKDLNEVDVGFWQGMTFDEKYKNAFMVLGVAISFIVCLGFLFFGQRCKLRDVKKASLVYPIVGGVSSALLNLLILLLISTSLSESIIFPGIAVGGLILTILFSTVFYREKISPYRWTGLFIGAIALVFLNL